MATQLQKYLVYTSPFVALWILIFGNLIQLESSQRHLCLYYLPFTAVFLFGVYALYSVVNSAMNISDCAQAQHELQMEIKSTLRELEKKGIVDIKRD